MDSGIDIYQRHGQRHIQMHRHRQMHGARHVLMPDTLTDYDAPTETITETVRDLDNTQLATASHSYRDLHT